MLYAIIENNKIKTITDKKPNAGDFKIVTKEKRRELFELSNGNYNRLDKDFNLIPETQEEIELKQKQARKYEILVELDKIDLKTIRPLRAGEVDRVAELDAQAEALRVELASLEV